MAYDPNDAADKKIVKGLIDAALAELQTEHEADIAGLKTKNTELLAKLKDASKGENNAADIARLETQLEDIQTKLKNAEKEVKAKTGELTTAQKALEVESGVTRQLLVDNGLTDALTKANVAPAFLPAVKAMLSSKVELKTEGSNRIAVVGDKPLGEFIVNWSQGDEGKHYVAASVNGGAGANGNKVPGVTKNAITRAAHDAMPPEQRGAFFASGGTVTEG